MGNDASLIKKCTIAPKPRYTTGEWSQFDATHGSTQYSLFVFNEEQHFNDITRWKHIRHPNLVKCYEAGLCKQGKQCILTEPVNSIRWLMDSSDKYKLHDYCKLSGLYSIGEALSFLHQICGISVNNLSIDSIFISRNDCNEMWKLGSLYWYSSLDSDSEEFFRHLISFHMLHGTIQLLPPEDREMSTHKLIRSSKMIHRRDTYSYASLIGQVLYDPNNPPKLSDMIIESETPSTSLNSFAIKSFVDNVHSFSPEQRPTIGELLNNQLFASFSSILEHIMNTRKTHFFETFIERLRLLPDQTLIVNIFTIIVSSRLIMSNEFIYQHVMPYFLIPSNQIKVGKENDDIVNEEDENLNNYFNNNSNNEQTFVLTNGQTITLSPIISTDICRNYIIPHISNLYCVHDYKIRMLLLLYLPHYGKWIPKTCLRKIILPQILLGIKDANNDLVSMTFHSLAVLVDLFGVVDVLGGSKRPRYFNVGIPRPTRLSSSETGDNISIKSSSSIPIDASVCGSLNYLNYKMPSHMISERSSPDGDEIRNDDNGLLDGVTNSNNNLNLIEDDNDEQWPEWENGENDDSTNSTNGFETAVESMGQSSETLNGGELIGAKETLSTVTMNKLNGKQQSSSSKTTKGTIQTFDIKEIDFNGHEEIDNLFQDMEPVFDFQHSTHKLISDHQSFNNKIEHSSNHLDQTTSISVQSSLNYKSSSEHLNTMINLNQFVPKFIEEDSIDLEHSGWNDETLILNDDDNE
ncbi:Protein-associating with the carboxyl-terminal domain of ezrin [Blomia tropicalis]|nr:Protein-associating with the carboxyl-terminal domain of ezrin [Blomia tropicalis]